MHNPLSYYNEKENEQIWVEEKKLKTFHKQKSKNTIN